MRPPNKPLPPLDPNAVARIRAKPLPVTPTERWRAMAILQEPLLEGAEWVQGPAFRTTVRIDGSEQAAVARAYLEGLFRGGLAENPQPIDVGAGMSSGGVVSAYKWDGVRRYLAEGQYVLLMAVEGFYLPSVDRQNGSYEIMSRVVPGRHILAAARVDTVDEEHGHLISVGASRVSFNHGFVPPPWLDRVKLRKRLRQLIDKLGAQVDEKEYRDVCAYLKIAP